MRSYSRLNKGHKYVLTVIDVLSKYAWAVPLKSKSGNEISETIAKIIGDDKKCPKNFQTDRRILQRESAETHEETQY